MNNLLCIMLVTLGLVFLINRAYTGSAILFSVGVTLMVLSSWVAK